MILQLPRVSTKKGGEGPETVFYCDFGFSFLDTFSHLGLELRGGSSDIWAQWERRCRGRGLKEMHARSQFVYSGPYALTTSRHFSDLGA